MTTPRATPPLKRVKSRPGISLMSSMDARHAPPSQSTTLVSLSSSATPTQTCDVEQRLAMIAEAAFYLAQRRNFEPGHEIEDWLTAEQSIDLLLSAAPPVPARVVRSSHDGSLS